MGASTNALMKKSTVSKLVDITTNGHFQKLNNTTLTLTKILDKKKLNIKFTMAQLNYLSKTALDPASINRFITNFYTFNSFLKNFNKPNANSNGEHIKHTHVKTNYFNYVLCKSLVKYQKKAKNIFSIRNLKSIEDKRLKQIECSKDSADLNNNDSSCSNLNDENKENHISNQKENTRKKTSIKRRDFLMRLIDFNFFILF